MTRYVAVHLHLYQPPREVPSLGTVAREVSAAPFHDWNERITAECYRPLTATRLLDDRGLIAAAPNLFEQISFNIGPTLHAWLEEHAPDVDRAIRDADAATVRRDGHGHAIAQPYAHAILPLATARDRETLVRWGVADFRHRFGRDPEGMWLPETAVDVATLETLAAAGITFTIVGQHQIARTRTPGGDWRPASAGVDPFVPYAVPLPSGRSVTVCAFDSQLSRAAAFDHALLSDGARFARRLRDSLPDDGQARLMLVATDGETFGHHHRFAEMALGRALEELAADPALGVGGIGAFLAANPPRHEAELHAPSAWSCAHGVERWRSDCGDSTGGDHGWNQSWRAPLRDALDWLRDRLAEVFEAEARPLLHDPWAARDAYAEVFGAEADARTAFVRERAGAPPEPADVRRGLLLLEMQRHMLLAFSSCGWFFSDCAGLETVEILRQAAYALELAASTTGVQLEAEFVSRLASMRSNDDAEGDGPQIWDRHVRPAVVGPDRLAAWWFGYATAAPPPALVGDHDLHGRPVLTRGDGGVLTTGSVEVRNRRTLEVTRWSGAAIAGTDGRFVCGVESAGNELPHRGEPDIAGVLAVSGAAAAERAIRDRYGDGCIALDGVPLEVRTVIVEARVADALRADPPPAVVALRGLQGAARAAQLGTRSGAWHDVLVRAADSAAARVATSPNGALDDLAWVLAVVDGDLPDASRWRVQNALLFARNELFAGMHRRAANGDGDAQKWVRTLSDAAGRAGVAPPT